MSNTKMVEAYVCNHCGDIFKTKEEAYACFKECEEDLNVKKTFVKLQNEKNELRLKATSFNHFAKLLEEFARKNRREIEVEFCNLRYEKYISNTHDCPIGGQTNWRKEKDKPTSYPGYIGKVVFKKNKEEGSWYASDAFEIESGALWSSDVPGLNTGCGGGGEFIVRLYIDDFPKIKEKVDSISNLTSAKIEAIQKENKKKEELKNIIEDAIDKDLEIINCNKEIMELEDQLSKLNEKKVKLSNMVANKIMAKNKHLVPNDEIVDRFADEISAKETEIINGENEEVE